MLKVDKHGFYTVSNIDWIVISYNNDNNNIPCTKLFGEFFGNNAAEEL